MSLVWSSATYAENIECFNTAVSPLRRCQYWIVACWEGDWWCRNQDLRYFIHEWYIVWIFQKQLSSGKMCHQMFHQELRYVIHCYLLNIVTIFLIFLVGLHCGHQHKLSTQGWPCKWYSCKGKFVIVILTLLWTKHIIKKKVAEKKKLNKILFQLRRGTEQLLFSFLLPSTLSTTSNIMDLQKLVTSGNYWLPFCSVTYW